jgi:hypothetical protein
MADDQSKRVSFGYGERKAVCGGMMSRKMSIEVVYPPGGNVRL